jgi:hypothetical protein
MFGLQVEIVHRARDVEIRVGVEPVDEGRALVAQVAFDLEVSIESVGKLRAVLQPPRKPARVRWKSGSSSRKASWPLSDTISTNETLAAAALSAWTSARLSDVGNSQSDVKLTTQKRVLVPVKASASVPPCSACRSK